MMVPWWCTRCWTRLSLSSTGYGQNGSTIQLAQYWCTVGQQAEEGGWLRGLLPVSLSPLYLRLPGVPLDLLLGGALLRRLVVGLAAPVFPLREDTLRFHKDVS